MSSGFPLAPFLASLASDGLRASLDDLDRIALTLGCGGPWSRDRLRGILLAILVRNEDQEAIFRKRFAEFFDLTAAEEEAYTLSKDFLKMTIQRFLALRDRELRRRPSTGECLVWLQVLALTVDTPPKRLDQDLSKLP